MAVAVLKQVVQVMVPAEVRESRARIVVAGDEARRRLERDLHDGAQQRLLTLGLALQMLRLRLVDDAASELLAEAERELASAIQELRALAAGIHPAVLTDRGLLPAIRDLADRSPLPVSIVGADPGRLPPSIETTAYFCTSEAVTNAIKHAGPALIVIELRRSPGLLRVAIRDDGRGGVDPGGNGIRGLADRVSAVNGTLDVSRPHGRGTQITVELPCA
jgi:signal transduction histidine kinase